MMHLYKRKRPAAWAGHLESSSREPSALPAVLRGNDDGGDGDRGGHWRTNSTKGREKVKSAKKHLLNDDHTLHPRVQAAGILEFSGFAEGEGEGCAGADVA